MKSNKKSFLGFAKLCFVVMLILAIGLSNVQEAKADIVCRIPFVNQDLEIVEGSFVGEGRDSQSEFFARQAAERDCERRGNNRPGFNLCATSAVCEGSPDPIEEPNVGTCATFFWKGDLTGRRFEVDTGQRIEFVGNFHNDKFDSAIVQPGFRVRAFEDRDFGGRELRLDDQPQFGRADFISGPNGTMQFTFFPRFMHDRVSSIVCERISQ